LYLNVDYKAIVIKIRHAVLKIFEQLYKIFEQLLSNFLAYFLATFYLFRSRIWTPLPIEIQILRRKWRWIGETLRKPANIITRQALSWNPPGMRKRGRPRNPWRRGVESEMRR